MGFRCLHDAFYACNVAVWLEFCLRKIDFSDRVGLEADQPAAGHQLLAQLVGQIQLGPPGQGKGGGLFQHLRHKLGAEIVPAPEEWNPQQAAEHPQPG